ncbi:hypothetical protein D1646_20750 [Pseudoflavonifractor sp. 60]|uniref:hypothetical protein n=1 Tax=Pseudoflavonifractor sp. 60 TaxID=2304576 RepID=UPI001369D456|nr:hypothetical protein [Pseudoflavonifractor sp. 60]NBI69163.1 hypothetical protein [Pseudoflavonifractor sp. 60]
MTIIRLHRHPRCPINCTSIPLLILPLENLIVQGEDGAAVELLLANLPPAQVQQLHSRAAASAVTKLERYFIKNGWMPKEA